MKSILISLILIGSLSLATAASDYSEDEKKKSDEDQTVGNIDTAQTDDLSNRIKSKKFGIFGIGPAMITVDPEDDISYHFYAGSIWDVNPWASVKAIAQVTSDFDNTLMSSGGLGANVYASNGNVSPYLGADMGFGYAYGEGESATGFSLGGSAGLLLFRTSDTQFNIEFNTVTILDKINDSFPLYYTGRIGILF